MTHFGITLTLINTSMDRLSHSILVCDIYNYILIFLIFNFQTPVYSNINMPLLTIENLGMATATYLGVRIGLLIFRGIKNHLASPTDVTKLGSWALVTGATDGIGKAYCFALAARGLNIVLVSRNPDKLKDVASVIEANHKVKTKVVIVDFKTSDAEYIPRVREAVQGLEIGVLVNNVGMMYNNPDEFLAIDSGEELFRDMVSVNITSVNAMTRLCLPYMVERNKGAIINIASVASVLPGPLISVYGATKAYVDRFSTSLRQEYCSKGIEVQTVLPGYVVTNMSRVPESLLAPNADNYVKSALSHLGVHSRTTGYWGHYFIMWLPNIVPETILNKFIMGAIEKGRERVLARREKEK